MFWVIFISMLVTSLIGIPDHNKERKCLNMKEVMLNSLVRVHLKKRYGLHTGPKAFAYYEGANVLVLLCKTPSFLQVHVH